MTTALITGGSGFLGQHLIRELRVAGISVRAMSRSESSAKIIRGLGAVPVSGDLSSPSSLRDLFTVPIDVVFHTAADTNTWSKNNDQQTRTNVEGLRTLLDGAIQAKVPAFVHTSSVAAYGLQHDVLNEGMRLRGEESWINYERNKAVAERMVTEAGNAERIRTIVLNPSHILGPGDTHNWSTLIKLIDQQKLPGAPPGSGPFADVREIARAHVSAYTRGKFGDRFLLGGPNHRFVDLIGEIGTQLGKPVPKKPMPVWVLKPYARVIELIARVSGKQPEITPEAAAFTCHHMHVNDDKARRELDYRHTPMPSVLKDTIAWMRQERMIG